MGYELHITRRKDWSDDAQEDIDISLEEWLAYVGNDSELELVDWFRIKVLGSKTESQVAPGFCEWILHPLKLRPWFNYSNGDISTKNPNEDTILKMLSISKFFNAKVQGDDGENYKLTSDNKIFYK